MLLDSQDIDTRPEDIRYNHHAIPNGELVRVDDPTRPVFQVSFSNIHFFIYNRNKKLDSFIKLNVNCLAFGIASTIDNFIPALPSIYSFA